MMMPEMLENIKAWAIAIATVALTIITLGGYARYQASKRKEVERENEALERYQEQQQLIKDREREVLKQNNEQRIIKEERKRERTYFDNLD